MADTSQDRKEGSWAGAPPPSSLTPGGAPGGRRAWIALLLAALALGGVYLGWRQLSQVPAPPPPRPVAPAPAVAEPVGPAPAAAPSEPSAGQRALLEAASASPAFRRWLEQGDPLNRWALVTANLAEGVVPRKALAFLAPTRPFEVAEAGGEARLSEAGYRRFDAVAGAIDSVDTAALAAAYRALHLPLEAAYRALGDPQGSLDAAAARALDRLAGSPVLDRPPALVPAATGTLWVFQDPRLEALGGVEKQLLRFGPRNGALVKAKAAAIRSALDLKR